MRLSLCQHPAFRNILTDSQLRLSSWKSIQAHMSDFRQSWRGNRRSRLSERTPVWISETVLVAL